MMIESAKKLRNGSSLDADVCIVGAGAAGIAMALRLEKHGIDILVLEAGGESETRQARDVYVGEVADPAMHSPTDQYRHRVLGGTTTTWGGRCIPLDPIDFEAREWVPNSGWPISYNEVAAYYDDATEVAEAGDNVFSAAQAVEGGMRDIIRDFPTRHFDTDGIERFSRPTNFGRRYHERLAASRSIRVVLDANCTEIMLSEDEGTVDHLVIRTFNGATIRATAKRYVLANGGIEVARLMLASQARSPKGVGNANDLVGRYYMCHIAGTTGEMRLSCDPDDVFNDYERSWDGVYCRRRFHIQPDAQRDYRLLNTVLRMHHPRLPDPAHGRGILSAIYLAKPFISYEYSKRLHGAEKLTPGLFLRHALNIVLEPFGTAGFLLNWMKRRTFASRKFPSLIVRPRNNSYSLEIHGEQIPNRDSRVTLAETRDRFGMPRVHVDWRWLPADVESVKMIMKLLADDLAAAGKGELICDPETIANDMLRDGAFGGHHIGTTRMSDDPARGVVDGNCRVFGVDNLFVASSAVFPTSGQANPVLTTLALTLRLADHLLIGLDRRNAPIVS